VNEQLVVAQLFGKGVSVETTATLDGTKGNPYHVVGDDKNYAVVWGPFTEKKTIQVVLYWKNTSGKGLQPIYKGEIEEVRSSLTLLLTSMNQLPSYVYSSPTTSFTPK